MQPTMKLRWLVVPSSFETDPNIETGYGKKLILQQWWENSYPLGNEAYKGEWRDIEIAEEE